MNLYRGPPSFIHLLRGIDIEVGDCEGAANPFRGNVLQLRANDREYGCEQNPSVSPDKYEVAHIRDLLGGLELRNWCGKISCIASGIGALLRRRRLLVYRRLRLRLRLLHGLRVLLLVLLIAAQIGIVVRITAKENRSEGTLRAVSMMPELQGAVAQRPVDCRPVRKIKS